MKRFLYLWQYLAELFLEWEIFEINVVEKIKTHILCSINVSECRAVNEIKLKSEMQTDATDDIIMWRMRFACWVSKAEWVLAHANATVNPHTHTRTHARTLGYTQKRTHTEIRNTYCFPTATVISRTQLSVTWHVLCLSCYSHYGSQAAW
jgi:hypothetical protein